MVFCNAFPNVEEATNDCTEVMRTILGDSFDENRNVAARLVVDVSKKRLRKYV